MDVGIYKSMCILILKDEIFEEPSAEGGVSVQFVL